jgi:hypothetical protein
MKKTIKILLWSVVAILIIGLAAGAFWWMRKPQIITFDTGDTLTLVGVDYGKHHVPPGVKAPAATTTNVTPRVARVRGGPFNTPSNALVVWVRQEHDPQQYAYFQYYLYDSAGDACVGGIGGYGGNNRTASEVVGVQFPAFPRRQGKFIVRVQEQSNGGQQMSDQKFIVRDPARASVPGWKPDALPNTQTDDDFSVTLTKLAAGAAMPYQRDGDDADDAANKGVQLTFHAERNGQSVTNWEPVSVETSDATGNRVAGNVGKNDWQDNNDTAVYQYGLWPDEPAWKVRLEFSQQSDFADNELWAAQDIPLEPGRQTDFYNINNRRANTNSVFAETDLNGYHLKIFTPKQFSDVPQNSYLQGGLTIQVTPALTSGMRMTLVRLTDDQTNDIANMNYGTFSAGTGTTYRYGLRDLAGATNLNLTIALHKSRFVEFTVKPEKAPPAAAPPQQ